MIEVKSESSWVGSTDVVIAEEVVRHYRAGAITVRAVDGVSLSVPRGSFTVLRGPSGCGKSTLLNLLGALDRPDSGHIVVDGVGVEGLRGAAEVQFRCRKVGFVFQQFNLVPHLTAIENAALPMEFAGGLSTSEREARARDLLSRAGLAPDRHVRRPSRLSGGEQQRVAIARALANDAPVLLADEPTANLDSATGTRIIELLLHLRDEGRTVVVASHDAGIARHADLVLEMLDGRLV